MQTHSMLGWAIVEQALFEPEICDVVRHHHERYDGNGYPDHLQMQQIPLAARVVTLCDNYEALISRRTYREAYSPAFARTYMQAGKGIQFDPDLTDLFFSQVISEKVKDT